MTSKLPSRVAQEKVILLIIGVLIVCIIAAFAFGQYRQQQQAAETVPSSAPLSIHLGDNKNDDTVVVYTDPVCDKCAAYHEDVIVPLYDQYIKEDKVNLEIRPIGIVSEHSAPLNQLIMCSSEQGAYMSTMSYISQGLVNEEGAHSEAQAASFFRDHDVKDIAGNTNMDEAALEQCLDDTRYDNKMTRADTEAYAANVYSTPTTFIGDSEPIRGYSSLSFITQLIDIHLPN